MKQKIQITENELNDIIKEVINEVYNNAQYANLAGQAQGALDSFGGRLKGFFNPKWKQRKQRQVQRFGGAGSGGDRYEMKYNDWRNDNIDTISNNFTNNNGDKPYQLTRNQTFGKNFTPGGANGQVYNTKDNFEPGRIESEKNSNLLRKQMKLQSDNSDLNRAYQYGRDAAMGKTKGHKTGSGVSLDGTGTKNGWFQHLGQNNVTNEDIEFQNKLNEAVAMAIRKYLR